MIYEWVYLYDALTERITDLVIQYLPRILDFISFLSRY